MKKTYSIPFTSVRKTIAGDTSLHLSEHPSDWVLSTPETFEKDCGAKVTMDQLLQIRAYVNEIRSLAKEKYDIKR